MGNSGTIIIGIGNEFRSDDAAGLIAANRIKSLGLDNIIVVESDGDGTSLINQWEGKSNVILIDAVLSDSSPGTIHRVELNGDAFPEAVFKFSTHLFSLPQAIKLSASLDKLPDRLIIFGIEAKSFEFGIGLSEEVESSLDNLLQLIQTEIINIQRRK